MAPPPLFLQNPLLQQQGFYNSAPLTLADLYQDPGDGPDYPEAPDPATSIGDLSDADRAQIRNRALLSAALALSAAPKGYLGSALAGAAQSSLDAAQGMIDAHNKQRQQQYELARQQYAEQLQQAKEQAAQDAEKQAAVGRLATYQQISTSDPTLAQQAAGAARAGDDKRLQALLQAIPDRSVERSLGYNPDDPFIKNRVEADIQTAAESTRRQNFLDTLPDELAARNDSAFTLFKQEEPIRVQGAINQAVGERKAEAAQGLLWDPKSHYFEPQVKQVGDQMMLLDMNKLDPTTGLPSMVPMGPGPTRKWMQFKDANGSPWLRDPYTGESHRDPNFDALGNPIDKMPPPQKSFWDRLTGSSSPAPAPPKSTGTAIPGARPAPSVIDQPTGVPAQGRGQGPGQPRPTSGGMGSLNLSGAATGGFRLSPLMGSGGTPQQKAQLAEQVTGPLPPAAKQQLIQRLQGGASLQDEINHILQAQQQQGGSSEDEDEE